MPNLTAARAARHEALYPRLAALEKQVVAIAGKKPELRLPPSVVRAAREVLGESQALLGRRVMEVGGEASDYASLAIALGQARTALEGFEAAHAQWYEDHKCLCWQIAEGEPLPVKRLLAPGAPSGPDRARKAESERMRKELLKLIVARFDAGYQQGYKDACDGKPMSSAYAERVWEAERQRQGKPY